MQDLTAMIRVTFVTVAQLFLALFDRGQQVRVFIFSKNDNSLGF